MNRENIEKMVTEFPKSMIAGWEKMHPEIGGSLEHLKSDCMLAVRRIRWIDGGGLFLYFTALLGTLILSAYFGSYFRNPTHQINWIITLVTIILGGVVAITILTRTWAMRLAAHQPVDLYESALTKFETSVIKLDCKACGITALSNRLNPDAIELAVDGIAQEVLRYSREFRECLDQKASVEYIVDAGQHKLSANRTLTQVVKALEEFEIYVNMDECFKSAKAHLIMKT
jgi:hypothetical protein